MENKNEVLNKQKEYKISVVIPCYNQEKYITDCLTSLAKQKFKDVEVIIVDDGSTDLTRQKIEEYQEKHDDLDIFYYYQDNAGPGVARNTALNNAHGKYIAFLDSDDKLPAGAYNALYYTAEKYESDIVIGEYFRRVNNGPWFITDIIKNYCKEHEGKNCAGDYVIAIRTPSLWNRLFRREFLDSNNIRFLPELSGEDLIFNLDAVKYAKNIYTTQSIVYCYTKRESAKDSLSTNWNLNNTSSYQRILSSYALKFDEMGDEYTEIVFLTTHFSYLLNGINSIQDEQLQHRVYEMFKELLAKYKDNIKYEFIIESIIGVPLNVALVLPYKAYRSVLYKLKEKNKVGSTTNAVTKYITGNFKEQTLQAFREGRIGLKYLLKYFKAWLKYKFKRKK